MTNNKNISYETLLWVIGALKVGVWEYDIDADHIKCDTRWYEILGIDEKTSPIHSLDNFRPHIHLDDVALATEVNLVKIPQLLADDDLYHVDFRIVRPGGEIRYVRSVASLIQDHATQHRKAVGCITDITDFRSIESGVFAQDGKVGEVNLDTTVAPETRRTTTDEGILTSKERACLMWVSLGKTATESSVILSRSRRTVEFHLNNAVRKLGATNKIHAAAIAIRRGII